MVLTGDMGADPDSYVRCHIEVSRHRIWFVLINRRGPVDGDAADDEAKKKRHVQPVTPAHEDMVSFSDEHVAGTAMRARGETTPYPGALESLVECAAPSRPCAERHLHLLGVADLSTQARSGYGKLRCRRGYRILDLRPCPWPTPLRQPARLDLQPCESRTRHVSAGATSALVVCLPIHAERDGVCCGAAHGRRMALLVASPDGCG